ncbi:serine hydrolase, partial [Jeotgalibaca porci]
MRTIDKKQKNFISFIILATVGVVLLVIALFSLWTVEETDEEVVMHSESQEVAEKEALEDILLAVMDEYGVTPDQIAISYYNFQEKETYALNEDWVMNAASTTKVATAMLFSDLIWQGVLDWDSELPYSDS